jgi:transposase
MDRNYSITFLTNLEKQVPFHLSIRVETNTAEDFFDYVLMLLEEKYLVYGDYLILDSAAVHTSQISVVLKDILDDFNIKLIRLPTFSPELNPCELVFAKIKNWMRENYNDRKSFVDNLYTVLLTLSHKELFNMYNHCRYAFMKYV